MFKCICRLAEADLHPGIGLLRDITSGVTYWQAPLTSFRDLLGKRREAFFLVTIREGAATLDYEIPVEDIPATLEQLL